MNLGKIGELLGIPLGWVMYWIYEIVNNYGLSIIIFTLLSKLIMLPASYKQQLGTVRMQSLNPKLRQLKKQYANNPQKMQEELRKMQEELEASSFEATAGGGVVKAVVSGKHELTGLTIDPEAVDPEDVEMLQDLIIAAVNEALRKVDSASSGNMAKLTGMKGLPF